MPHKTNHAERVEMLREETVESVNGMWATLLMYGTQEARDAFTEAADEAGFALHPDLTFALKSESEGLVYRCGKCGAEHPSFGELAGYMAGCTECDT